MKVVSDVFWVFCFVLFSNILFPWSAVAQDARIDTTWFGNWDERVLIELKNNHTNPITFSLHIKDWFYLTEEHIIDNVKQIPDQFANEPLEQKAWRFVIQSVDFTQALTQENWGHSPELLVNSIGRGQCDDLATFLSYLWRKLGFESRVWELGGHVVPEVFIDGKWRLFDPSYQVYYTNGDSQIVGVEELGMNPELITNPVRQNSVHNPNLISVAKGYSKIAAHLYSTTEDNFVQTWYDNIPSPTENLFMLPAFSSVKFPVRAEELNSRTVKTPREYLVVSLQSRDTASLKIPLVIDRIEGSGNVMIDSINYSINSESLIQHLKTTKTFISELKFTAGSVAQVYYLMRIPENSPSFYTVSIEGENTEQLAIHFRNTEKNGESKLNRVRDSIFSARIKWYESQQSKMKAFFASVDPGSSLQQKMTVLGEYCFQQLQQENYIRTGYTSEQFNQQLNHIFQSVKVGKISKKFEFLAEDPLLFLIFFTTLENDGVEFILSSF